MAYTDLLTAVQPTEGYRAVVFLRNGIPEQHLVPTLQDVEALVAKKANSGSDVYFGVATYKDNKSRKKENVQALKSIWLDIDCGESKDYPSQAEGIAALQEFCQTTDMPRPLLVSSGRGVHAYWRLEDEIAREEWEPIAARLRDVCTAQGLNVDPSVFEAARVLRIPGTLNHKDDPPKPVEIISEIPGPVDVDTLKSLLGVIEVPIREPSPARELTALGKKLQQNQVTNFAKIMRRCGEGTGCQQLLDCYVNQKTLAEPRWFDALSIAKYCEDKESAIHKMSSAHPGYDYSATELKITHILGPHTCAEFDKNNPGGCHGCPHFGQIKSPIVLGRDVLQATLDVEEEADEEGALDYKIPAYPDPYFRGQVGGIYRHPKSDEEPPMLVYEHDLYAVKIMTDPELGDVVLMRLHLPCDGVRSFVVPISTMADKRELHKTLASYGVVIVDKCVPFLLDYILTALKDLQYQRRADKMRTQFGWVDGDSKFILGDREIAADGVYHSPPSSITQKWVDHIQPVGSLEKWKEVMELYGRPGHEPFAFAALTAFGAPLLKFLGQNGAIINLIHPRSGTGKTTVLRVCNSVYGHPDRLCSTAHDTFASKIFRLGVMSNLPYTIDEITNMHADDFSNLAYSMSQGRGRDRMMGSKNEMRVNNTTWQTISLCSSNASFNQKLAATRATPEGELMRLIEYKVDHVVGTPITQQEGRRLFDHQLLENYGHAGEPYIQYLIGNLEHVIGELKSVQSSIDKMAKLSQKERFWSAVLASNIMGGLIAKHLGLISWDLRLIRDWAVEMVQEMREDVSAPMDDASTVIGNYLNCHVNHMLVVNENAHANAKGISQMPMLLPRNELLIRYEPDTEFIFIARSAFRHWCVQQRIDIKEVLKELKKKGVKIDTVNKRLSKGMKLSTPPVYALRIDASHTDFVDMDSFVESNKHDTDDEDATGTIED